MPYGENPDNSGRAVYETLSDHERGRLIALCMAAVPREHGDHELTALIAKLSGTDTQVILRRAYPSRVSLPAG